MRCELTSDAPGTARRAVRFRSSQRSDFWAAAGSRGDGRPLRQRPVGKLLLASRVLGDGMAIPEELVFVGGEPLEPHGPASVQLARADAKLGAKTVAVAVGEPCGGILKNAGGVHFVQKSRRCDRIFG